MNLLFDDECRTPVRFAARRPDWLDLTWETMKDAKLADEAKARGVDVPAVHQWIQSDWASVQLAEERRSFWRKHLA
jgi:hypothetical protein